jgi:hypothetical protein
MTPPEIQGNEAFETKDLTGGTGRRTFLTGAAATVAAVAAGRASAKPSPSAAPSAARKAFDPATFTGPGFESETGNQVYHFPRDNAMHGGPWYRGAEYQETHYFTGFFKEKRTGISW